MPVLLTPEVKEAIDCLIDCRRDPAVQIPEENVFLFAANTLNTPISSWTAVRTIAQGSGAIEPNLITSNRLRKYNASMCQMFDMSPNELQWLSNHMGHEVSIHLDFYRYLI